MKSNFWNRVKKMNSEQWTPRFFQMSHWMTTDWLEPLSEPLSHFILIQSPQDRFFPDFPVAMNPVEDLYRFFRQIGDEICKGYLLPYRFFQSRPKSKRLKSVLDWTRLFSELCSNTDNNWLDKGIDRLNTSESFFIDM